MRTKLILLLTMFLICVSVNAQGHGLQEQEKIDKGCNI